MEIHVSLLVSLHHRFSRFLEAVPFGDARFAPRKIPKIPRFFHFSAVSCYISVKWSFQAPFGNVLPPKLRFPGKITRNFQIVFILTFTIKLTPFWHILIVSLVNFWVKTGHCECVVLITGLGWIKWIERQATWTWVDRTTGNLDLDG